MELAALKRVARPLATAARPEKELSVAVILLTAVRVVQACKGSLLAAALAAGLLTWTMGPAFADFTDPTTTTDTTLIDPLHGYCAGAGQCIDNGSNSPTTNSTITGFGFTISPGPNTGSLLVDVLVPTADLQPTAADLTVTGTGTANLGTAALVSPTPFNDTTGPQDLYSYLGLTLTNGSPKNPIGSFNACANCTSFDVYQVNLGTTILQDPSAPNGQPSLTIGPLPLGSYIVGFLSQQVCTQESHGICTQYTTEWISTAQSGAIYEAPEPTSLMLLATGLLGFGLAQRVRRMRKSAA